MGYTHQFCYVVADVVIAGGKHADWETDSLAEDTRHLHSLNTEIVLAEEFKLWLLGEYGIYFAEYDLIADCEVCFLNDDSPAEDSGEDYSVLSLDRGNPVYCFNVC